MGYYINVNSKGDSLPVHGKAEALKADGAKEIAPPANLVSNLVCVVERTFFDAAGYIFSEQEMQEFLRIPNAPKTWLIYEHAEKLAQ